MQYKTALEEMVIDGAAQPVSLKLVSLNIEGARHLERVLSFLRQARPEVVCLQELYLQDFEMLKEELGMEGVHAVMVKRPYNRGAGKEPVPYGIGMFSAHPFEAIQSTYYHGSADSIREIPAVDPSQEYGVFMQGTIRKEGTPFTIGTTHFTWTPNGQADERQRAHLKELFRILDPIPEIVFCGDFNAPRGREIFGKIAQRYEDHIPPQYTTSIDKELHRKGDLQLMVDGLFSTKEYGARHVRLVGGISDHYAIAAEIYRTDRE